MFCEKCGSYVLDHERYCQKCGQKVVHTPKQEIPTEPTKKYLNYLHKTSKIVISIILILCVLTIPMFNFGGHEIFPNERSVYITDILNDLSENDSSYTFLPTPWTAAIFAAGIFLLIAALCNSKKGTIIFSIIGFCIQLYILYYAAGRAGADIIYELDDTLFCIGFWAVFGLFIAAFCNALRDN